MLKALFESIYNCKTESDIDNLISVNPYLSNTENWFPIGQNESNFSIIENQQSNPIAALVEKVTNSIDATLMKKRSEEHTSELQSRPHLVCRLLLEKKKKKKIKKN